MEAVGVGITDRVEPVAAEVFAVTRRGEQARDGAIVGGVGGRLGRRVRRGRFGRRSEVREEGVELGGRGREAGEVEREAAELGLGRSERGEREARRVGGEFRGDETVDRIFDFGFLIFD